MVSINSSANAIANWNNKNSTGTTGTSGSITATEPTATTSPSETTGSSAAPSSAAPIITASVEPVLVYAPPARSEIGQAPVASRSLDGLLSDAGFFSRSAAAETSASAAVEQVAASTMPAALSQAEVIARAAYAIVADANADSAASSLIKQFG